VTFIAGLRGSKLARVAFWSAALFALGMALDPHPPSVPHEPSDKVQHMVAFATLAALGPLAYPRLAILKLFAGLSLFGAAIEVLQAIPILHRDSDPLDWLADTVACGAVLAAVAFLTARPR
jgi:hypothetical protein